MLRSESPNREDVDPIGSPEGNTASGDHREKRRWADNASVDLVNRRTQRSRRSFHRPGPQLDFAGTPPAIRLLHDRIDLVPVGVAIVIHVAVDGLGVDPQVSDDSARARERSSRPTRTGSRRWPVRDERSTSDIARRWRRASPCASASVMSRPAGQPPRTTSRARSVALLESGSEATWESANKSPRRTSPVESPDSHSDIGRIRSLPIRPGP